MDSFTYQITAPDGQTSTATETITTSAAPAQAQAQAPIAVSDSYTTAFNAAVSGVAGTGDTFAVGSTFAQTSQPAHGTVAWNADGTYTYTPSAGWSGVDSFTYQITAPDGQTSTATETITTSAAPVPVPAPIIVSPQPNPPVVPDLPKPLPQARPDLKSGKFNQVITLKPVLNDIKAGAELIPTSISLCAANCELIPKPNGGGSVPSGTPLVTTQGTWNVSSDSGTVTFKPAKNWFGRASIEYFVLDAEGNAALSTITISIAKPKMPKKLVYTGDAPVKPTKTSRALSAKFIGTITAPRLGDSWSQKIFEGTSVAEVLNPLGLGHYEATAMPGEIGNFAVAGHRFGSGGPFLNIDKFRAGDLVHVKTAAGKTFTYRYLQTKVVKPSEVGVLLPTPTGLTAAHTSDSLLTLQTCTPVHINSHRLIVWFELVN